MPNRETRVSDPLNPSVDLAPAPGITLAQEDALLRVRLDRPEKKNALAFPAQQKLVEVFAQAATDESLRAVLVEAEGEHFCTGADFLSRKRDPEAPKPRTGSAQRRLPQQAHRLIPQILELQLPVVCAVRGWCAGIGLHIALAADFVVASDTARLWEPFAARGFTPDSGGSWLLTRLVGMARAKRMLLLGQELSAEEAADWGLVHEAVPDAELDGRGLALARELAEGPTVALGLMKRLVAQGAEGSLEDALRGEAMALELSSRSGDFREGAKALVEKRPTRFEGR